MDKHSVKNKIYLTGSDAFILALENHNYLKGSCGNACRYIIELNGSFEIKAFEDKINQNKNVQWLSSLVLFKYNSFTKPYWQETKAQRIPVRKIKSNEFIPAEILTRQFIINQTPLLTFDILERSDQTFCLVFSWHHLLMDGYGATLLLQSIENKLTLENSFDNESKKLSLSNIFHIIKANFFVYRTSKKPLTVINHSPNSEWINQKIKTLHFNDIESKLIENNAIKNGAHFGTSVFYLACAAQSIKDFFISRKITPKNFWVPLGQSTRKKRSSKPLLGNHLSFLFFRIKQDDLSSLKANTISLNNQMISQMRKGMPLSYFTLIDFLKRTPSKLYYFLIKGRRGKNLASFLFTIAEDHPKNITHINNITVKQAYSLPPNNYKPGITFVYMKHNNCLQVIFLYYKEILSEKEISTIFESLKKNLLSTV